MNILVLYYLQDVATLVIYLKNKLQISFQYVYMMQVNIWTSQNHY